MSGFIQGIRNSAGRLISAIRESITDKLPKFVKDALDIHSPSRVFMAIGGHVGEGMALGIEGKGSRVTKAADALVAIPALAGNGSQASAAGSPVVGSLSIESRGDAKGDLEEALFQLRKIRRGGR